MVAAAVKLVRKYLITSNTTSSTMTMWSAFADGPQSLAFTLVAFARYLMSTTKVKATTMKHITMGLKIIFITSMKDKDNL